MTAATPSKLLNVEFYIVAAETHGRDSDPDHEVGDLQDFLRAMWDQLTEDQRIAFAKDERVQGLLEAEEDLDEERAKLP